jgi:hypothetical protein
MNALWRGYGYEWLLRYGVRFWGEVADFEVAQVPGFWRGAVKKFLLRGQIGLRRCLSISTTARNLFDALVDR